MRTNGGIFRRMFGDGNLSLTLKTFDSALVTKDYDEGSATAHVRKLLDVVACTTSFGPSENKDYSSSKSDGSKSARDTTKGSKKSNKFPRANAKHKLSPSPPPTPSSPMPQQPPQDSSSKMAPAKDGSSAAVDGEGEMSNTCPKLGSFYEFFISLSSHASDSMYVSLLHTLSKTQLNEHNVHFCG